MMLQQRLVIHTEQVVGSTITAQCNVNQLKIQSDADVKFHAYEATTLCESPANTNSQVEPEYRNAVILQRIVNSDVDYELCGSPLLISVPPECTVESFRTLVQERFCDTKRTSHIT